MSADKATALSSGAPVPKTPATPGEALARSAVGSVNLDFYVPLLARYEANGKVGATWNWSAALYTLNWMVFRRMWRPARIYLAALISYVVAISITLLQASMSEFGQAIIICQLTTLLVAVPGLYGNAWFIAGIQKKVIAAVERSSTMVEAGLKLKSQASTRKEFIRLLQINGGVALVAIAFFVAFHAQNNPGPNSLAKVQAGTSPDTLLMAAAPSASSSATSETQQPSHRVEIAAPQLPASMATQSDPAASAPVPGRDSAIYPCVDCNAIPKTAAVDPSLDTLPKTTRGTHTLQPQKSASKQEKPHLTLPDAHQYFVNVGLFAKEANADATMLRLRDVGLPAAKQDISTANGLRSRVRAGPFETAGQADEAAVKIRLLNLEAKVLRQR